MSMVLSIAEQAQQTDEVLRILCKQLKHTFHLCDDSYRKYCS